MATYVVSSEQQGFTKIVTSQQQLEINQSLRVDLRMKVGSVGETVEAEATQVETINPTIGGTVSGPPIQKWNQFGATFGGPIDIPGVIHGKDRFFFFFAYQGQRQKSVAMLLKLRYRVL